jgi:hypothetical protein
MYTYTFDLSHPTNLNTRLSFSEYKNSGLPYRGVQYVSTPGTAGSKMILTLYNDLKTHKLFTFNDVPIPVKNQYDWGYSKEGILTRLDKTTLIKKVYEYYYANARQYSWLSVYESAGPKFSINDFITPVVFLELNQYLYNFTYGTYYLEIPKIYASTLLNKGYEDYVSFVGDENKKIVEYVYGTDMANREEPYIQDADPVNELAPGTIIDGSYNFYYGRVQMNIYKPFPFRFSVYSRSFGFMGGGGLFHFVDSSESLTTVDNVLKLKTYNTIQKGISLRMNGDTSTLYNRKYGLSMGSYIFDIPSNLPIAFMNSSKENVFSVVATSTSVSTGPFSTPDGNKYLFYTGRINVLVKGYFETVSICTREGYSGGYKLLAYNAYYGAQHPSIYTTHNSKKGLCAQNTLNVLNNKYISFNDDYVLSQYGMSKGVYTIFNIPKECPITLLNNTKNNLVKLESLQKNAIMQGTGPDGSVYNFYYGVLRITVYGNFGFMTLYTLFNGYMGGYKMFEYNEIYDNSISYPDPLSIPLITEVTPNTVFNENIGQDIVYQPLNLFQVDNSLPYSILYTLPAIYNDIIVTTKIEINAFSPDENIKFTMKNGIYLFRCMDEYITVINRVNSNNIKIRGVLSITGMARDGYTYTYYKGDTIAIYVYGNFGMASLEVYGGPLGNYMLSHEDNILP